MRSAQREERQRRRTRPLGRARCRLRSEDTETRRSRSFPRFGYPTEKPVGLIKTLLSQSTQPGELIIDPCFGSGSSLIAADELGLEWMGNDLSPAAHEYFHKRRLEAANVSA